MQKHTKNQKKKDLYLKKKYKYIPDEWEKMELQLIKNFNNRLVSTIDLLAKLMKRQLVRIKSTVFLKSLVIYKHQKVHIQH